MCRIDCGNFFGILFFLRCSSSPGHCIQLQLVDLGNKWRPGSCTSLTHFPVLCGLEPTVHLHYTKKPFSERARKGPCDNRHFLINCMFQHGSPSSTTEKAS